MNNNNSPSAERKCNCGRYITLGELKDGVGVFGYQCPTCFYHEHSKPITSEEFYEQIERVLK